MPRKDNKPGISVGRAADLLGLSPDTVRRYVDGWTDRSGREHKPLLIGWRLPTGERRLDLDSVKRLRLTLVGPSAAGSDETPAA